MWYKQAGRMSNLINYMRKLYQRIRSGEEIPEEDLIRLSKRIHNFYSTKPHSQYQIATRQYEDICSEWEKARDKRKKELERMESEQSEELNKTVETESNEPMNIAASYTSTTTKKAQETAMKAKEASNRNYVIFHKGPIEMNGKGISYIIDKDRDEKMSPDQGIEAIIEDLSGTYPEFYDYQLHLYINADMAGYGMEVDYHQDKVPSEIVDKVTEWLWQNVGFERIEEDSENKFSKTVKGDIMKINSNTIGLTKESAEFSKIEDIIMKIAAVNGIKDVDSVQIQLTADKGIVGFKTAEIDPATGQETGQQVDPATGQTIPGAAVAGGTAGGAGLTEADYSKIFAEAAQGLPQQAQPQATPTQQQVSPQTV